MLSFLGLVFSFFVSAANAHNFKDVAIGPSYTCGYTNDSISCWGENQYNQAMIQDGFSGIKQVDLNETYGCLLDEVGLNCWGNGAPILTSELLNAPDATMFDSSGRGRVCILRSGKVFCTGDWANLFNDIDHVSKITVNPAMACALHEGLVTCRSENSSRRVEEILRVSQGSLGKFKDFSLADGSGCALNEFNQLSCWDSLRDEPYTVQLSFKADGVQVSKYHHVAFNKKGDRYHPEVNLYLPADFGPIHHFIVSADGGGHCAVNEKIQIYCWGSYVQDKFPPFVKSPKIMVADILGTYFLNGTGEIVMAGSEIDFKLRATKNVRSLSADFEHLCFIDDLGPTCLGGSDGEHQIPNDIKDEITSFSMSKYTVCAVVNEGKVRCWGNGFWGEANPPKGLKGVTKMVGNEYHYCALDSVNKVSCWGEVKSPSFGHNLKVLDLIAGHSFSCALFENKVVECWGENAEIVTVPPYDFENVHGLISGKYFVCAYGQAEIQCWGQNNYGQTIPPRVKGKIKQITGGEFHACLEDDEKIKCWGKNTAGEYHFFQ